MSNDQNTLTLAEELSWRGFVNQTTFENLNDINTPRTFYWGVDPSAESMTIGNLAPAMMIRHFMNHGHTPILLVGGATGMIGDPDGKKQERDLKTLSEIEKNKAGLAKQYQHMFNGQTFDIVDNYDWFKDFNYLDFLRTVGKNMSMTQLLDRDFIQKRIGAGGDGISYAEFSYSLIQGYDFLHLFREKNATLQLSGADQWGNCISGVQLIRKLDSSEAHVFTMPLIINKSTGQKFGKTEAGAIWLDAEKTSPYQFYQFWLNIDDETAEDLIKIYTMLSHGEIDALIKNHCENRGARALQKTLAREVTQIVHSRERCESVERVTAVLFGSAEFSSLSESDQDELAREIITSPRGKSIIEILVESNFAKSNGEARRLLENGAISINGEKILQDATIEGASLLKKGKNAFVLIR